MVIEGRGGRGQPSSPAGAGALFARARRGWLTPPPPGRLPGLSRSRAPFWPPKPRQRKRARKGMQSSRWGTPTSARSVRAPDRRLTLSQNGYGVSRSDSLRVSLARVPLYKLEFYRGKLACEEFRRPSPKPEELCLSPGSVIQFVECTVASNARGGNQCLSFDHRCQQNLRPPGIEPGTI